MNPIDSFVVLVDGRPHAVKPGATLADIVVQLGHGPTDVATAVNGEFASRPTRSQHALQPGDSVTLFQPIVGG